MTQEQNNEAIEHLLASLKVTLLKELDLGGLHSRNPIAHKWKSPFRSLLLRETVYWRSHDLLSQSYALHRQGHGLGARILLRGAIETLAMLIYLNQRMELVLDGSLEFHDFNEKTEQLLLGSKNRSTPKDAINILTVLDKCEKRYTGIRRLYDELSESAHPNYEGMSLGYTGLATDWFRIRFLFMRFFVRM